MTCIEMFGRIPGVVLPWGRRLAALTALWLLVGAPVQAETAAARPAEESLPARAGRDRRIDFVDMDLRVSLDFSAQRLSGTVTYKLRRTDDAPELVLDAAGLQLGAAAWLQGDRALTAQVSVQDDSWHVTWPAGDAATARRDLTLRLNWAVQPRRGLYFVRPDADEPKRPLHAWTQGETHQARYWLPCPDDPDERMTWSVAITAPQEMTALSNGDRQQRTVDGPLATTTYRSPWPLPIYLLTLAVGPFVGVDHPGARVPLTSWVLPGQQEAARRDFARLPKIFDFFERLLGVPYAFSRYGQVVVHEFHFGGMENATLTTLNLRSLPDAAQERDHPVDPLLAHELAHQWFGDTVTCRHWGDVWLNEGLASWLESTWAAEQHGPDRLAEALGGMRRGIVAESARAARPMSAARWPDPDQLFDSHAYNKGAWVAHMLRARLGDAAFFAGMKSYLTRHKLQSVEAVDLRRAMEDASGRNLQGFFRRWVDEPGVPSLRAELRWNDNAKAFELELQQTQRIDRQQPVFDLEIEVAVRDQPGDEPRIHRLQLDAARRHWSLPAASAQALVEVDPRMAVLADWSLQAPVDSLLVMARLSKSADVRDRAVHELAKKVNDLRVIEGLAQVLAVDPARHVRASAATALGGALRKPGREGLLAALKADADAQVRAAAATALGNLRDPADAEFLAKLAAADPSYAVRAAALRAVLLLQGAQARDLLISALSWPSHADQLRVAAVSGLASLGDHRDRDILLAAARPGQSKLARQGALEALGQWAARQSQAQDEVRQLLESALHEDSEKIRLCAALGLAAQGDVQARPALIAAAQREMEPSQAEQFRALADGLGRQSVLEERLRKLEDEFHQHLRLHPEEPPDGKRRAPAGEP